MYGGWAMPAWYKNWRLPIMVVQILFATLVQAQGMPRRIKSQWRHYLTLVLCIVACFFAVSLEYRNGKFYCNYMLINVTMYFVNLLTVLCVYRVSFCTAALAAANGYLMQEMAGAFKTILRLVSPVLEDV